MREILECAVLAGPHAAAGIPPWAQPAGASADRLRLHAYALAESAGPAADPASLIAAAALHLQRYDACLLPVEPGTLPWARLALLRARPVLRTPILVLAHEVKAPALVDLLDLGVADFVRAPLCAEELRARLIRMSDANANAIAWSAALREPTPAYPQAYPSGRLPGHLSGHLPGHLPGHLQVHQQARPHARLQAHQQIHQAHQAHQAHQQAHPQAGTGGGVPAVRHAAAAAVWRRAAAPASRPRAARGHIEGTADVLPARVSTGEPFRQAKARVVNGFERDYLHQALERYGGNVAQAARASCKHRRAFWALMRKHCIDAAPYRAQAQGREPAD